MKEGIPLFQRREGYPAYLLEMRGLRRNYSWTSPEWRGDIKQRERTGRAVG